MNHNDGIRLELGHNVAICKTMLCLDGGYIYIIKELSVEHILGNNAALDTYKKLPIAHVLKAPK